MLECGADHLGAGQLYWELHRGVSCAFCKASGPTRGPSCWSLGVKYMALGTCSCKSHSCLIWGLAIGASSFSSKASASMQCHRNLGVCTVWSQWPEDERVLQNKDTPLTWNQVRFADSEYMILQCPWTWKGNSILQFLCGVFPDSHGFKWLIAEQLKLAPWASSIYNAWPIQWMNIWLRSEWTSNWCQQQHENLWF